LMVFQDIQYLRDSILEHRGTLASGGSPWASDGIVRVASAAPIPNTSRNALISPTTTHLSFAEEGQGIHSHGIASCVSQP
jgi:hypothetical protein